MSENRPEIKKSTMIAQMYPVLVLNPRQDQVFGCAYTPNFRQRPDHSNLPDCLAAKGAIPKYKGDILIDFTNTSVPNCRRCRRVTG